MKRLTCVASIPHSRILLAAAGMLASASISPAPPVPSAKDIGARGSIELDFDSAKYRERDFPGYCVTYAVFRNEKKRRPLFALGRGAGGAFDLRFDISGLTDKDEPDGCTGEAKLTLGFFDGKHGYPTFFRGEAWNTYACGQWINLDEPPTIDITMSDFRDWKAKDKLMRVFMNPDRKRPPPGAKEQPIEPCFSTKLDLTMRVGQSRTVVKDLPCDLRFVDMESCWGVKFLMKTTFQGADIGLLGDDAGPISMVLVTEGFCRPLKSHRAPTVESDDKGAPALKIPD